MTATSTAISRRTLLLLFVLALVVRVGFVAVRGGFTPPPIVGAEAGLVAEGVVQGRGFVTPFGGGSPSTHLPPGYPMMLAGLVKVEQWLAPVRSFDSDIDPSLLPGPLVFYAALAINMHASAALVVVAAKLAQAMGASAREVVIAGALMCVCPESLRAAGLIWDEALLALCVGGMLLLMLRRLPKATWKTSAGLGVLTGVLTLLNPAGTLALACAWLAALRSRGVTWGRLAVHGGVFAAMILLGGLPWHVRNWVLLDPPARVFVRGNFWLETWSNLNSVDFTPRGPVVVHPWPGNGSETMNRDGKDLTEQEYFAWCRERALARLSEPGVATGHVARQVDGFWLGLAEARRWHRSEAVFFLAQGVPFLLGITGLFLARRKLAAGALGMMVVMLLVLPLPYYLAGGAARYRHPLDVILYIGVALGVDAVLARRARG